MLLFPMQYYMYNYTNVTGYNHSLKSHFDFISIFNFMYLGMYRCKYVCNTLVSYSRSKETTEHY